MTIDIRKPEPPIVEAIEFVQQKHGINTISKSLTFICKNYLLQRKQITELTEKEENQRKKIKELEAQLKVLKDFKEMLNSI